MPDLVCTSLGPAPSGDEAAAVCKDGGRAVRLEVHRLQDIQVHAFDVNREQVRSRPEVLGDQAIDLEETRSSPSCANDTRPL
jgi:hypothetical protein